MEAVDLFTSQPGFGNIICIAEADNYRNGLLNAPGSIWTPGARFIDDIPGTSHLVWDTDFTDPDRTGNGSDSDTFNFDSSGTATAYFCGHGRCDDMPGTSCTSQASCGTTPPPGMSGPAHCIGHGPTANSPGKCAWRKDRVMVIDGDTHNIRGGIINYTNGATVKWGEMTQSGTWGGAGTNGGIHFPIISNSCGMKPPYWFEYAYNLFAGAHLLGIIMPVTYQSDDGDAPDRGTWVAQGYRNNANTSAGQSFIIAINSMAQNEGTPCPFGASNYANGGGHGIGGCGAHTVAATGATLAAAQWATTTESWLDVQVDDNASKGNGFLWIRWVCNYNCNQYPFELP